MTFFNMMVIIFAIFAILLGTAVLLMLVAWVRIHERPQKRPSPPIARRPLGPTSWFRPKKSVGRAS